MQTTCPSELLGFAVFNLQKSGGLALRYSQEFLHGPLIPLIVSSLGTSFSIQAYAPLHKTLSPVIKWDNLRDCSPSEEQRCQQFPNQKYYILQAESQALQT